MQYTFSHEAVHLVKSYLCALTSYVPGSCWDHWLGKDTACTDKASLQCVS